MCHGSITTLPWSRAKCLDIMSCAQQGSANKTWVWWGSIQAWISKWQENNIWNCWKGIPWNQHGLTWLATCANIWLYTRARAHTHTPFQVIEIMEKHFYKDIWQHVEAGDTRWDHYRSVLKHLPVPVSCLYCCSCPRCQTSICLYVDYVRKGMGLSSLTALFLT